MAKRVCVDDNQVNQALEEHERDWVLIAVVRTVHSPMRGPDEEERELYFERKTSFGFGKR